MADLIVVLAIAALAGLVGLGLGIFFLAPRLTRLTNRADEEPDAGPD